MNQRKKLKRTVMATGLTLLITIIGFAISFTTDTGAVFISLFTAVTIGLLALLVLLFGTMLRRGGLRHTDPKSIGLFVLSATALALALLHSTTLQSEIILLLVVIFGLALPHAFLQYTRVGSRLEVE